LTGYILIIAYFKYRVQYLISVLNTHSEPTFSVINFLLTQRTLHTEIPSLSAKMGSLLQNSAILICATEQVG